jgi:hypothetical protein
MADFGQLLQLRPQRQEQLGIGPHRRRALILRRVDGETRTQLEGVLCLSQACRSYH